MTGVVALTGATGFIGRALVPRLLAADWRVKALLRRPDSALEAEGVQAVRGALGADDSLRDLVAEADVVIHCAGAIKARSRAAFQEINAAGTAGLAATAAAAPQRPRFLLLSSLAAREPGLSDYAASKRQAEAEVARHAGNLDWVALRPPAVYGPGDQATLTLFKQFSRGQAFLPRPADKRVSLLFIDDLIEAILHLLERPRWQGDVIELDDGRPQGYAWTELAEIASAGLEKPVATLSLPRGLLWLPAAANEVLAPLLGRATMLTRGKLRELFHEDWVCRRQSGTALNGWQGHITFEQGFPRTLAWYKERGWL